MFLFYLFGETPGEKKEEEKEEEEEGEEEIITPEEKNPKNDREGWQRASRAEDSVIGVQW